MQLFRYHYRISSFLNPYNIKKKVVKYTKDGIPFITVTNRAILYCQHGADQHVKTKTKYTEIVRVRLSFVLQLSVELDESKIELCLPLLKQFNLTHSYTHRSSFKTRRKNFFSPMIGPNQLWKSYNKAVRKFETVALWLEQIFNYYL